jgi:hypothetical protein
MKTTIRYFDCTNVLEDRFLTSFPEVSCIHDPEYQNVFYFIIFLLVAFGVGLPVYFGILLIWSYKKNMLNEEKFRLRYGLLYEVYENKYFFWVWLGSCFVFSRWLSLLFFVWVFAIVVFAKFSSCGFVFYRILL